MLPRAGLRTPLLTTVLPAYIKVGDNPPRPPDTGLPPITAPVPQPAYDPNTPVVMPGDATNREAWKKVLGLTALGVAGGAGLRALLGFRDMAARSTERRRKSTHPAVVEITVPEREKSADGPAPPAPGHQPPAGIIVPRDVEPLYQPMGLSGAKNWWDWFAGRTHENLHAKPWFWTAALGLPTLGAYGAYKGVDALASAIHKKDRESEMEEAKEDYRKALLEQYNPSKSGSASRSADLNSDLDELVATVKKADWWNDLMGTSAGMYLPIAALLAGGSGALAYNWAASRSPQAHLAKAIKQRERIRMASRPPEIYAVTKPVPVKKKTDKDDDRYAPGTPEEIADVNKVAIYKLAALYRS